MTNNRQVRWVLAAFPPDCHPRTIQALGTAGGFSGAQFWQVDTARGLLCLRRWPRQHPSSARLKFMHAVLQHVFDVGYRKVPVPLRTRENKSYVRDGGYLWELTPWLSGKADYVVRPSQHRLHAAMSNLAEFHTAAAAFSGPDAGPGPSPGIASRQERVKACTTERLAEIAARVDRSSWPDLADRAATVFQLFPHCRQRVEAALQRAASVRVPLQPCIRDVWHGHVLFEGDDVSALVDFGAMNVENVATDVARLLGSLVDDDGKGWDAGRSAYEALRPLNEEERTLLTAYDESGVLLSGLNWLSGSLRKAVNLRTVLACSSGWIIT